VGPGERKQPTWMEARTRRTCHGGVLNVSFMDVCLNGRMPSMSDLLCFCTFWISGIDGVSDGAGVE